ncbi:MAG: ABC transporter substrate-binding protein [Emcibacter sp.]|nr:ABC transporter substrate-binding protein [Emcibacter sp.]
MKQSLSAIIGLASATILVVAGSAYADNSSYPMTIENCGKTITFDAAPARAVTIGQSVTEILYSLGLGEKVVGTSVWFSEVLPQYAELNAGIKRLSDNDPSFESVVATKPGIIGVSYEWHVGPKGLVATREQFHDVGIPTYILPTDCVKDNTVGGDGTRLQMFNTDALQQAVLELANILNVPDAGKKLVMELTARETAAIEKVKTV